MAKRRKLYPYEAVVIALTMVTNCFIIAGVSRHWNYHDNTKLATPQQEATEIQEETTYDTGSQSPYQNFN
tara:strand:+ start:406 stop:615 length:210 start_codon:yes stop_codon:yes gene_type:complete